MSEVNDVGSCFEVDGAESDRVSEVTGSEAMFREFVGPAREVPKDEVVVFRGNASIVFHNVSRGVKAIEQHKDLVESLPGIVARDLFSLPNLALALAYADSIADRAAKPQSKGETRKNLSRAAAMRRVMLLSLEACAEAGIVPKEEVQPIRSGSGPLDLTGDLAACIALFRKHCEVLKNKTPITPEMLEEASEVTTLLRMTLKPAGTITPKQERELKEMEDDCNRLWTLLLKRYGDLRRVASFIWGDDASKHVPALMSRVHVTSKAEAPPAEG